jgi:glycosyltransferase involved in cell wall biosynthesis
LYIEEQLHSILNQSMPADEIVLVDDASSDDTLLRVRKMVDAFAVKGTSLRVYSNQDNLGYIKNFEKAVLLCKNQIIFLCDQDDVWHSNKIETMLAGFDQRPELLLAYSDARIVDLKLQSMGFNQSEALDVKRDELELIDSGRSYQALLVRNLVTGATVAFRKSLLAFATPFPSCWIHDEWLAIIAASIGDLNFCRTPLIDYRQHESNQIGMRRRDLSEKLRSMFRVRGSFYETQVERAELLQKHLESLGQRVDPEKLNRLSDRLEHLRFRAKLPPSRLARVGPALAEWRSGRYRAYSNGLRAVVRDLFEPT